MTSVLYLIAISLCLGMLALAAFLWSLRDGQYDDMEGAASRILFDEPPPPPAATRPRTDTPSAT